MSRGGKLSASKTGTEFRGKTHRADFKKKLLNCK